MRTLRFALVLGLLAAPKVGWASGYYVGDVGTHGLGRAGAFVASPDTALAIHYNPSGLSHLRGFFAEVDLSLVNLDFTFSRSCPCVDASTPNAAALDAELERSFKGHPARTNTIEYVPFIAIGYGFPVYDLTVEFAAYGPNSGAYDFGSLPHASTPGFETIAPRAVGRYVAMNSDVIEANYSLGFGLQPIKGLRLGGAVMMFVNSNDQHLDLWLNAAPPLDPPERADLDVPVHFRFKQSPALNWQVGGSYDLLPGLSVGASFRGKRSVRAAATIDDFQLPEFVKGLGASIQGNNAEIELNTPPIANFGVQYAMPEVFKAEAAFVYERWRDYNRVVIRPKDIVFTVAGRTEALAPITQDRRWTDSYSIRVGGELNLFEPLFGLSAGWFYEPSAIPADRLDLSRLDLDKMGFALGLRTTLFGATLEIAGMYVAMTSVDVRDSQVKLVAPLNGPLGASDYVTTVANGRYDASYLIGTASLAFKLDPVLTESRPK